MKAGAMRFTCKLLLPVKRRCEGNVFAQIRNFLEPEIEIYIRTQTQIAKAGGDGRAYSFRARTLSKPVLRVELDSSRTVGTFGTFSYGALIRAVSTHFRR